jgi:hypothetical protein
MSPPSEPTLEDRDIPPDLANQFQVAFGLDESPATLAEWAEGTSLLLETARRQRSFDDWCRVDRSRHEVRSPKPAYYMGLFDTLLVLSIRGKSGAATIRSHSPVSERLVEVHSADDGMSVTPGDAVMSFGVATDVVSARYFEVPDRIAYTRFSQYTNAFSKLPAYERWDRATAEAETMMIPLSVGLALARRVLATYDQPLTFW